MDLKGEGMKLAMIDTNKMKRSELVPLLTAAAVNISLKVGVEEKLNLELGTHLAATLNGITILYRTPKAMIFTAPSSFGVDIWDGPKCFSVIWNSQQLKDFEIINFKRGPWIPSLLSWSEQLNSQSNLDCL